MNSGVRAEHLQNIDRRNIGKGLELIEGENGSEQNKKGIQHGIIIPGVKVL